MADTGLDVALDFAANKPIHNSLFLSTTDVDGVFQSLCPVFVHV